MTVIDAPDEQGQRLDVLEAAMRRVRSEVADLAGLIAPENAEPDGGFGAAAVATPVFASAEDWVDHYWSVVFVRAVGGTVRWCNQWREHPEAVLRLEALWRSWETLRLDANLGIATWLTTFADPQISALTSGVGTFASCTPTRHA
jgi:hypothetical protein